MQCPEDRPRRSSCKSNQTIDLWSAWLAEVTSRAGLSSRSVRAGCVAGHRYGAEPCGWPARRLRPVWLPHLCRAVCVAGLIGRAAAVAGQQAELDSARVQCGWPASAHRVAG